jgi:hypothetical protein
MHQMTIFEWLQPVQEYPDINDITEAEAAQIVGKALGLNFVFNEIHNRWIAKKGKLKIDLNYSHYVLKDNHDLFLGVGWQCGTSGGASPCHGIADAIKYFQRAIKRTGA